MIFILVFPKVLVALEVSNTRKTLGGERPMARKRKAKHPKPVKGRCPKGYHKGKTKKTKGKCVRSTKRKR